MLKKLDVIPWSRLKCHIGYADHVPMAVRCLLSEDPKIVEAAYWQLDNYVVVQGSLYEAAAYLPDILIEALDLAVHKGAILELLFEIGNGQSLEDPALRRVCHAGVIANLERWLAVPSNLDSKWRETAMRNLTDLREDYVNVKTDFKSPSPHQKI